MKIGIKAFTSIIFFFITNILIAQSFLKVNIFLENKDCQIDTTQRTIIVQMLYNDKYITISEMLLKKCQVKTPIINGKYRFYIYALDYQTKEVELIINNTKADTVNYPDIFLKKKIISLNEVIINSSSNKGGIEIQGDKMIINLKGNALLSTGSTFDAIEKTPGVMINQNGQFILNGKSGTKIWIDGMPSNLSGDDLAGYLKSLPATIIDKIEIISNPGAAYDAQSSGGIINLITTKQKLKGVSGTLNINTSLSKYAKDKSSLRLGIKYRTVDIESLVGLSTDKGFSKINLEKEASTNNATFIFSQNNNAISRNQFFYLRNSIGVHINPRVIIGFRYNHSTTLKNSDITGQNILLNQLAKVSITTSGQEINKANQKENGLYFMYLGKRSGSKLEASIDYSIYNKQTYLPLYENSLSNNLNANYFNISKNNFEQKIKSARVSILTPLQNNGSLEIGTKYTSTAIISNGNYNLHNNIDIIKVPNYDQFILFKYYENITAGYFVLSKNFKKIGLSIGSRVENTQTKISLNGARSLSDSSYTNFFPSATLSYPLSSLLTYTLGYSKKINRPGYSDLDPNINYSDSLSLQNGNPYLKSGYLHTIESKLIFFNYASLSFSYGTEKNSSYLVIDKAKLTNQTITITKNFNYTNSYFGMLLLPIPIPLLIHGAKWLKNISTVNAENVSYLAFTAAIQSSHVSNAENFISGKKPIWFYGIYSNFILPHKYKLQVNFRTNTKGNYGLYTINSVTVCDLALTKLFLQKKLNVSVAISDLFKSNKINVNANFPDLKIHYINITDSRVFRLSLTYNFGKFDFFQSKKEIKQSGEEEVKRVSSQKNFKTNEN